MCECHYERFRNIIPIYEFRWDEHLVVDRSKDGVFRTKYKKKEKKSKTVGFY